MKPIIPTVLRTLLILFIPLHTHCRLKAPPITFTQTATAAEKQMIGEDKDIEKDGWILSSIRTTSTGSKVWKREVLDQKEDFPNYDGEIFSALRKISYFSSEVYEFKKMGFLGETPDGNLEMNPNYKESLYYREFPKNEKRIRFLLTEVNSTRSYLRNRRIEAIQSNPKLTEAQKETKILEVKKAFYNTVEKGEFYKKESGSWSIKE